MLSRPLPRSVLAAAGLLVLTGLAATIPATPAAAQSTVVRKLPQDNDRKEPVLFKANEITYDDERAVVVAKGDVEITRGDKIVLAERVTYNRNTEVVTAQGNVTLLEPGGNTVFADYMELSDDFREGVIDQIRLLMSDGSRMAGYDAERLAGNITVLRRGVYSPCDLCKDDPKKAPLWQVKANRITHDEAKKKVTYKDVTFEAFGVPVLYTPSFSHPDPSVKRESGFLAPLYGRDRNLGFVLRTPYYWSIAPDRDLTVTPYIMTGQGLIMENDYRQLFEHGRLRLRANGGLLERDNADADGKTSRFRGSLRAQGDFDLSDIFRTRFDIYRSTDDTYLRKFNYDSSATLRSRVTVEGFDDRRYLSIAAQTSQETRQDVAQNDSPTAIPDVLASWRSYPTASGDIFSLDAGALMLLRTSGTQSRRITSNSAWTRPWTSPGGHLFEVGASLRADAYSVRNDPDPTGVPASSNFDGFTGRLMPTLTAGWRLPMISPTSRGAYTLEPRVSVVASPNSGNTDKIPNEDSQDSELDIDNLFRINRFQGWDRVEGGQRINYALTAGYVGPELGRVSGSIGQSYRLQTQNDFAVGSGLNTKLSDIVGGLNLTPSEALDFYYRFRIAQDDGSFGRNEIGMSTGPRYLRLDLDYSRLGEMNVGGLALPRRDQVNFRVRTFIGENWAAYIRSRYDLENNEALINQAGLRYMDECIVVEAIYGRHYVYDRDVRQSNTFYVRLLLRNFGDGTEERTNMFGAYWRQ